VQRLRRLSRRRSARTDEGAFVIDGPLLLAEALAAGIEVREVIAEPTAPDDLLARAAAAGALVHQAPAGTLARAADTVTPQSVAAIAALPGRPRPSGRVGLAVVAVGLNDPGNAGTLLRSADASGVDIVVFCDESVDPYNPKCVRAAAGSLFRLSVVRSAETAATLTDLRADGVRLLGMVARGGTAYDHVDYAVPSAVVLGNEAHGLPADVAASLDELVTIPMSGPAESLNVGMAGTIVCFEALRQRRARSAEGNQLDGTPSPGAGFSAA
jgi:TrmH family RNA methyltransferase